MFSIQLGARGCIPLALGGAVKIINPPPGAKMLRQILRHTPSWKRENGSSAFGEHQLRSMRELMVENWSEKVQRPMLGDGGSALNLISILNNIENGSFPESTCQGDKILMKFMGKSFKKSPLPPHDVPRGLSWHTIMVGQTYVFTPQHGKDTPHSTTSP